MAQLSLSLSLYTLEQTLWRTLSLSHTDLTQMYTHFLLTLLSAENTHLLDKGNQLSLYLQLVSILTGFDTSKEENKLLFVCRKTTKSKPVKL